MLPIHTILHPTDFSENSDWAFGLACSLAKDYGARLIVVHVALPPAIFYGEGLMVGEPVNYLDDLRKKLYRMQPGHPGVPMEHRLIEGDAANGILDLVENEQRPHRHGDARQDGPEPPADGQRGREGHAAGALPRADAQAAHAAGAAFR